VKLNRSLSENLKSHISMIITFMAQKVSCEIQWSNYDQDIHVAYLSAIVISVMYVIFIYKKTICGKYHTILPKFRCCCNISSYRYFLNSTSNEIKLVLANNVQCRARKKKLLRHPRTACKDKWVTVAPPDGKNLQRTMAF
jgi:hypothetical protein